MRLIQHPGPVAAARLTALPCHAAPLQVTLRAGQSLAYAVQDALASRGFQHGFLRLDGARFAPLRFVTPAPATTDAQAAWYSQTYEGDGPMVARHAGVHLGLRAGQPFVHCHGLWEAPADLPDAGHMLCDESILMQDATVTGWGLTGAGLVSVHDPETNFTLFQPQAIPPNTPSTSGNAFLLTLRPNQDITEALHDFAQNHRVGTAQIHGIGSLVGTSFQDGRQIDSYATEILILRGTLQDGAIDLQVASVGFDGRGSVGPLARGANAICVTAEILVLTGAAQGITAYL